MKRITALLTTLAFAGCVSTAQADYGDWSTQRDVTRNYCYWNTPYGDCDYSGSWVYGAHSRKFRYDYTDWNKLCEIIISIGHTNGIFNATKECWPDWTEW